MRATLFHNPNSGSGTYGKDELLAALKLADVTAAYCSTKKDGLEDCLKKPGDLVIAAGGDGTIAKVLTRLPDRSIPIAILPTGTANNIARSLGIMGAPLQLVEDLKYDHSRRVDIGRAEGAWGKRHFVEAVGVGLMARSVQKKPNGKSKAPKKGADALAKARRDLQKLMRKAEALDIEIVVDGKKIDGDFLAVEVLNVTYTGPALPLAPDADPGDGKFDIVCFPVSRRDDIIAWLDAPHDNAPPFAISHGRKVTISGNLTYQRVDDEVFEPAEERQTITIEIEHEAAKVLVPPDEKQPAKAPAAAAAAK